MNEKISCGYFTGKSVPAGCRGVLDYARRLAIALHDKHYPEVTQWRPESGNLKGLLLQIDNMTAELVRPSTIRQGIAATHLYRPHPKYPWFCEACGYPEREPLQHTSLKETTSD